jgi:hypothetical protein
MKKILLFLAAAPLFAGCYNDKADQLYPVPATAPICDTSAVSYSKTVLPLLSANCSLSGCHDGTGKAVGVFTTYAGAITDTGVMVSYLTGASGDPMPKNANPLSTCNIDKIAAWIAQGAQNN